VRCSAYGLDLELRVPLPDLAWAPPAGRAPLVVADGEGAWSGPAGPRSVRQVDGRDFVVERGRDGDVLLVWGDAGRFHLSADGARLEAGGDAGDPAWQRVLLDSVLASVALALGAEALHAAAVALGDGAVAVVAGAGAGKTTLAAALVARGGRLLADDVSVVDAGLHVHPAPPVANVATAGPVAPERLGRPLAVLGGEAWVAVAQPATTPAPLRRVVVLGGESAGPPAVLRHMLASGSAPERAAARFGRAAEIAALPVLHLASAPPDDLASQVLDAA
jgi:hypothetical protein